MLNALEAQTRRDLILGLLDRAGGRFAAITFTKKDGTERKLMVQPAAVETHTTGCKTKASAMGVLARRINHPHLIPVFDTVAKRIKSINLNTVSRVSVDGVELTLH